MNTPPTDKPREESPLHLRLLAWAHNEETKRSHEAFTTYGPNPYLVALLREAAAVVAPSAASAQEGYPGIAHDLETMRSALVQIRDECFNGHAHDIAEAALNAAPQGNKAGAASSGAGFKAADSDAGYCAADSLSRGLPNNPAAAAPTSSELAHVEAIVGPSQLVKIDDGKSVHVRTASEWLALARADLSARSATSAQFTPTHQHAEGGLYRVLRGVQLKDGGLEFIAILYENEAGEQFVRRADDFARRFTGLSAATGGTVA